MKRKEFVIGLCVIIALLITIFGVNYLKGINLFRTSNYYYASYTNVTGLSQSAPVTINGYKVGEVREIVYDYDNPGHIRLELSLEKALKLTKGSKAVLVTDLLGTSSIQLVMGGSKQILPVGDTIEGVNGTGLMDAVSNDLMPGIAGVIPKVDSLLTVVTALASDPSIASSLQHLNATLVNIDAASCELNQLMGRLTPIVGDAGTAMHNVRGMSEDLVTVGSDLTQITATVKSLPLDSTMHNLMLASKSLNSMMDAINSDQSSLGLLMHDPQLYNNLNAASASLDSLLIDVKRNPKRYISIKLL